MITGSSAVLVRAASILRREAAAIQESLTVTGKGWVITDEADRQARADYDEMVELAAKLEMIAGAPDPLAQALNEGDGVYRP